MALKRYIQSQFGYGNHFHSYQSAYYNSECFIAIAGSTLTAQHVVNLITEHLGKLQITFFSPTDLCEGGYKVVRHCQPHPLNNSSDTDTWDEAMFTDNDYTGIIVGEVFDEVIEHSINTALKSARKYKLDEDSLRQMYTEFAAGYYCPSSRQHKLFTYKTSRALNDDKVYEVSAIKNEIGLDQIAVLGMSKEFKAAAENIFTEALASNKPPASEMFQFLNSAIDQVHEKRRTEIDRPSVLQHFERGKVKRIDFKA